MKRLISTITIICLAGLTWSSAQTQVNLVLNQFAPSIPVYTQAKDSEAERLSASTELENWLAEHPEEYIALWREALRFMKDGKEINLVLIQNGINVPVGENYNVLDWGAVIVDNEDWETLEQEILDFRHGQRKEVVEKHDDQLRE